MAHPFHDERGPLLGQGRTAEIYAWSSDRALKLYYAGWPAASAKYEAQVSQVVATLGLPTPAVDGVLAIDGRTGVLFERLVGPSLLHLVAAQPWTFRRAVRTFTDLHLAMHMQAVATATSTLPSQRERLARQIAEASDPDVPDPVCAAALRRLDRLPEGSALCHGDYHPDNVLVTRRGAIIIDWGSASCGHPLADVAQTELLLLIGEPPALRSHLQRVLLASARAYVRRTYVSRYLRRRPARGQELAAWRLPVAVARLGEGILEERPKLLRLIAKEMADG
jgi:aminoglycoside phosphotransferase (APT) family kinase protein